MAREERLNTWKSDFGVDYTKRNTVLPDTRVNSFKTMVGDLNVDKILEIGCNIGHNLIALSRLKEYKLIGLEPSKYAILQGRSSSNLFSILEGDIFEIPFKDGYFDLVFTSGVLIHISIADLPKATDEMYRVSNKYMLVVEYFAEKETVIPYHGHNNMLWKRDFSKYFTSRYPNLKLVRCGFWDRADGFDRTHWWLFEK